MGIGTDVTLVIVSGPLPPHARCTAVSTQTTAISAYRDRASSTTYPGRSSCSCTMWPTYIVFCASKQRRCRVCLGSKRSPVKFNETSQCGILALSPDFPGFVEGSPQPSRCSLRSTTKICQRQGADARERVRRFASAMRVSRALQRKAHMPKHE